MSAASFKKINVYPSFPRWSTTLSSTQRRFNPFLSWLPAFNQSPGINAKSFHCASKMDLEFNVLRDKFSEPDRVITLQEFQALNVEELNALIRDANLVRPDAGKARLFHPSSQQGADLSVEESLWKAVLAAYPSEAAKYFVEVRMYYHACCICVRVVISAAFCDPIFRLP